MYARTLNALHIQNTETSFLLSLELPTETRIDIDKNDHFLAEKEKKSFFPICGPKCNFSSYIPKCSKPRKRETTAGSRWAITFPKMLRHDGQILHLPERAITI